MIPAILLTVNPHLDVVFKNGKVPIWYDHFHKNSQAQRWGKTKSIWWWSRWKCLATKEGIENCAENTSAKNWQKCRPKNGETEELTVLMKAFGLGQSEEKNRHQVRSQVWTSFCPNISNRKFELTCAKRQTLEWRPGIKTVCAVQPPPILYIFSIRSHLTNLKMECFYPFVLAFIKLGNLRPLAASSLVHVSPAVIDSFRKSYVANAPLQAHGPLVSHIEAYG